MPLCCSLKGLPCLSPAPPPQGGQTHLDGCDLVLHSVGNVLLGLSLLRLQVLDGRQRGCRLLSCGGCCILLADDLRQQGLHLSLPGGNVGAGLGDEGLQAAVLCPSLQGGRQLWSMALE